MEEKTNKRLKDIMRIISKELKLLGIPPSREGYWFIRDSIYLYMTKDRFNLKITKDIYPKLSKKYNKKTSAIEKAIRSSIEKGWNNCDLDHANELFTGIIAYNKDRPTNNEFISTVSEYISLEK